MRNRLLSLTLVFLILSLIPAAYAQCMRHEGRHFNNFNLTDSQKVQIEQLKLKHQEEMIKLISQLQLKKLDLKKLETAGNIDRDDYIAAVNAVSEAKNKIAEERANHRMDIYSILDEKQKLEFLSHPERPEREHHRKFFRERE